MLITTLSLGGIIIGGAIGYACAQAIRVKREADELADKIKAEETRQRFLKSELRWVIRCINETQAEIARREKQKKRGLPVGPKRRELERLTACRMEIESALQRGCAA